MSACRRIYTAGLRLSVRPARRATPAWCQRTSLRLPVQTRMRSTTGTPERETQTENPDPDAEPVSLSRPVFLLAPLVGIAGGVLTWTLVSQRREDMREVVFQELATVSALPKEAVSALASKTEKELETNHVVWTVNWSQDGGRPEWRIHVHARRRYYWSTWAVTEVQVSQAVPEYVAAGPTPQVRRWDPTGSPVQWRTLWQRGKDVVGVAPR